MDKHLVPPLRIQAVEVKGVSNLQASVEIGTFLEGYQAREGDATVSTQVKNLLLALQEKDEKK